MGLTFRDGIGIGDDGGLVAEVDDRRPCWPRPNGVGVSGGLGGCSSLFLRLGVIGGVRKSSSEAEAVGMLMGDDLVDL